MRLDSLLKSFRIKYSLIIFELVVLKNPEDVVGEAHHVQDFIAEVVVESDTVITEMNHQQALTLRQGCVGNRQNLFGVQVHAGQVNVVQQVVLPHEIANILHELAGRLYFRIALIEAAFIALWRLH